MPIIYIHSGHGDTGIAIVTAHDVEKALTVWLRDRTKPLAVGDVAHALKGIKADPSKATMSIKVDRMKLTLTTSAGSTLFRVHNDRKPGVNQIKDWRRNLPPFLPNGQCRG